MPIILAIDTNDPRPIYQQVADSIKELIARGELPEGTQLPPVRHLAADLGVNLNTIATAYHQLKLDGLTAIKHGSGSVIASRKSAERPQGELLRPLRAALTDLVLGGYPSRRIMKIVARELIILAKGTK